MAALIAGQYATSGAITRIHGMHMIGWKPSPVDMVLHTLHNRAGLAIIALMLVRLALRLWAGGPLPGAAGRRSIRLAQVTHAAFYAVLITEGITGAVASYLWWPISAVHVILFKILLGLVALHVGAAVWHWLVFGDGTFERMGPGPFRIRPTPESAAALASASYHPVPGCAPRRLRMVFKCRSRPRAWISAAPG